MNHLAGKYINFVQRCILCGEVICDDRGACWADGGNAPKGFAPGPVYKQGNMTAVGYNEELPRCNDNNSLPNF